MTLIRTLMGPEFDYKPCLRRLSAAHRRVPRTGSGQSAVIPQSRLVHHRTHENNMAEDRLTYTVDARANTNGGTKTWIF